MAKPSKIEILSTAFISPKDAERKTVIFRVYGMANKILDLVCIISGSGNVKLDNVNKQNATVYSVQISAGKEIAIKALFTELCESISNN
jgi:hypothetical protein